MFSLNRNYLALTAILFTTEVLIALFVHDSFVRTYLGDALVVILIYCFIKSFLNLRVVTVALFTLIVAFIVEFLQYVNIVERFGIESEIARVVLGTSYAVEDLFAYVAGIVVVIVVEKKKYWCERTT